ncbi:MAG: LysM peptidoglycan-binding domain-containing protein [Tepidisphaeraceae bacterium]
MITRETKIGLLVGLAFILVVGILLSEHVTQSSDRTPAPLQASGNDVRKAVEAPMAQAPTTPEPKLARDVQPSETIVTRDQLAKPAVVNVAVGGAPHNDVPSTPLVKVDSAEPGFVEHNPTPAKTIDLDNAQLAGGVQPGSLVARAKSIGEELVPLTAVRDLPKEPVVPPTPPVQPVPPEQQKGTGPVKEYTAVAGDSLNKLAGRFLGGNTAANRAAIVALNPQLQSDPNKVIAGQKYLIPVRDLPKTDAPKTETAKVETPKSEPAKQEPKPEFVIYTVKSGDSLWKIAQSQLGDARQIDTIKQLNADVLGEGETVKVDMKLKLPKSASSTR